ncbi:MAG: aminodeoxychorismate lyase [Cellvibrionales bacterium]|nr:aminodeoxychorismate lyase [Cellvibrionales bacterium]|tara:strand:- start:1604 stop:2470 length:867 start_codon:yes stop_codon:yes gene_type:complete
MSEPFLIWFNGKLMAPAGAEAFGVNESYLLDRANSFGDGVFETLLVKKGEAVLLDRHLQRLYHGLHRLSIPCVRDKLSNDLQLIEPFIRKGDNFILKIVVSRGSTLFGYSSQQTSVNRLLLLQPYTVKRVDALRLMVCETRLSLQPLLAGIKHCNRLEQVLARREVDGSGCDEGVMLDHEGRVVEATAANLFIVESNEFITAPIVDAGVIGVVREFLIEDLIPQLGFSLRQEPINLARLKAADACLLTNSVQGLRQVASLQSSEGMACQWSQHALLSKLQQAYQAAVE